MDVTARPCSVTGCPHPATGTPAVNSGPVPWLCETHLRATGATGP